MGAENRKMQRKRKRIRVTIAGSAAFTSDISPGGFCVETMAPQRPGTDVSGELFVAQSPYPFTGKVAWAVAGDLRVHQRGRMGIRLTGISSEYYQLFL
jgi:hypothetical protein